MKKIISLIASVAMLASVFTSVSAASLATNNPVVSTTIEEIDEATFCDFTYEDALEEGNVAYLVTVDITGLDLSCVRGGSATTAEKKTRTGVLLSAAQYDIVWDSEDNIVAIYDEDREAVETPGLLDQTGTALGIFNATTVANMIPKASNNNDTVVTMEEVRANSFVVVTDGTPVTGTVEASLVLREKVKSERVGIANYNPDTIAYSVNGEETNAVTLGAKEPDPEPPVPQDMTVTIGKEFELEAEGVQGYAWEVVIANYDSTKTLSAKFIDEATGLPRPTKPVTEITGLAAAETEGSIEFVALLKLSAPRSVSFDIVVE